jgi:hypothetical protein
VTHYLDPDQFEIVGDGPAVDIYFPAYLLRGNERFVLDAENQVGHRYILVENQTEAQDAIQDTLYSTRSQKFLIVRLK